ncbi:MAG: peptidylprolyl isomerase [Proteobacteria bacterium]|nr:peptidylprolyl isomerase [Pseudomonadota bacterium]
MTHRLFALTCLVLVALTLGGCSKCGWIWEQSRSCHSDRTQ